MWTCKRHSVNSGAVSSKQRNGDRMKVVKTSERKNMKKWIEEGRKEKIMMLNIMIILTGILILIATGFLLVDSNLYAGFYSIVYVLLAFLCVLNEERLCERNKRISRICSIGAVVLFVIAGAVTIVNILGIM